MRIEKWRLEQSQALIDEVERETRRRLRRGSRQSIVPRDTGICPLRMYLGSTPKQSDYLSQPLEEPEESEPFWRRFTRRFIQDVIGIDEPLLSVIFGESLPDEAFRNRPSSSHVLPTIPEAASEARDIDDSTWRDKLLQRIAGELGVFVHQLSPHPGAFTTYSRSPDYAGMPVLIAQQKPQNLVRPAAMPQFSGSFSSGITPNFPPTVQDPAHAESWGFEEEAVSTILTSQFLSKPTAGTRVLGKGA